MKNSVLVAGGMGDLGAHIHLAITRKIVGYVSG